MSTVRLPPGPSAPRIVQGGFALAAPLRGLRRPRARYGDAFTVNVPIFGRAMVISDPAEIKQLFTAGPELVENLEPNLGRLPDLYQWIPYGGGTRRCFGAAFANMEMNIVLRTMLRGFTLNPTTERDERRHFRGVAYAPAKGGPAVVRRRASRPVPPVARQREAV